jgi:DNA replication and repair protein RecF
MSLQKLDIYNVRNIRQAAISPSPTINLIYGDNGSGKSSLLEAIHILGRAQSFRTANIKKVINFDSEDLIVSGRVSQNSGRVASIGVQLSGKDCIARIDLKNINSRSQMAYALPIQLIFPKSSLLLDGSPHFRREFMDWGVFNYSAEFLPAWKRFKKALQQRNASLKEKELSQLDVWNHELVEYGKIVADFRRIYVSRLTPVFREIASRFFELQGIELKTFDGWDSNRDFLQVLQSDLQKDCRYGFTHSGPHRGDFYVLVGARHVNEFVSRGQLKLLIVALKLAQVKLLDDYFRIAGCILIDDLSSELDSANRSKLMRFLAELNVQVFMTATEIQDFDDLSGLGDYRVFHVEHGNIKSI